MTGAKRRRPPEILVEQLELGELSATRRAEVEAELASAELDPRAALRASNAEILRDYPSERVMAEVRRRAAQSEPTPRPRAWLPWVLVPSLAGAAALVLVLVMGDRGSGLDEREAGTIAKIDPGYGAESTRIKGGSNAHLVVDRKLGASHERLIAGELIREHDLVQISVVPDGQAHGVILSIDGRGTVTLHHPATPEASTSLPAGTEVPLASSYELDDAPGFERFILITRSDDESIDVAGVLAAAGVLAGDSVRVRTDPLPLVGEEWEQSSLELRKPGAQP